MAITRKHIATTTLAAGGILMLTALVMWMNAQATSAVVFVAGAVLYSLSAYQHPIHTDIVLRRLYTQYTLSLVLFVATGILMCTHAWHWTYLHHNEWMVSLAVAVLLHLYTTFRISHVESLLLLALFASCTGSYSIDGEVTIDRFNDETLYLKALDGLTSQVLDSCKVTDGKFTFSGHTDSVIMAAIYAGNVRLMPVVLDDKGITVTMNEELQFASGTEMNDSLYSLIAKKNEVYARKALLPKKLSEMIMDGEDFDYAQSLLSREALLLDEESETLITSFIKKNIGNALGVGMFVWVTQDFPFPVLTPSIEEILTDAGTYFRKSPYVSKYMEIAEENMLRIRAGEEPEKI